MSKSKSRLSLETLEGREVPAVFGFPWASPAHLTVSFAPDGTKIAGNASDLNSKLDAQMPAATWQAQILKALQTWAVRANIDIGVVADDGSPFGANGPTQGDTRFGDIRIGGLAMAPTVLAVSTPPEPFISGTWAGDVIVNTAAKFGPGGFDLFTAMLHESGHVFGLGPSTNPGSVMFNNLIRTRTALPGGDIVNLQSLYGRRAPDVNDGKTSNGTLKLATRLKYEDAPGAYKGETPVVAYGDITTNVDVDNFWIQPIVGYDGPMTFRLQTSGISLLTPKMTILDSAGKVLGQAISSSMTGDTLQVHLNSVDPAKKYFIRIEGAAKGVFGIGRYGLAAIFDEENKTPESRIDQVLRGPYESLSPSELQAIFENESHEINDDHSSNEDSAGAGRLKADAGYAKNGHYGVIASLASATDRDFYQVRAIRAIGKNPVVLTATVWTLEAAGQTPRIELLDANSNPVNAQILANGNGRFTIQAPSVPPDKSYFVVVEAGANGTGLGNYQLTVDFGTRPAVVSNFISGNLTTTAPTQTENLFVARTQLFHLLLSAQGAPGSGVRMTITDSAGNVVSSLAAAAGDTVGTPGLLLKPGAYTVKYETIGTGPVTFSVRGSADTDPIGPLANDPTTTPTYTNPSGPGYVYPGNIASTIPYLWALLTL